MPRELGDVLHYLLPELKGEEAETRPPARAWAGPLAARPAVLPLVGVPIGDRDVVRAAFTWNLAVEVARLGGRSAIVAPKSGESSPLWPAPGVGPMGAEVVLSDATNLGALHREALDVAVAGAVDAQDGGVVFVRVPPTWLRDPSQRCALLRWILIFTSADARELLETYGIAKLLMDADPDARVGVTIHGARRIAEAKTAFARLARNTERHLGRQVSSYGLLVDDLHVYRAIVSSRPIGLAHPQAPAARALRDVARMILDDARERAVA